MVRTAFLERRGQHISVEPVNTKCPQEGQRFFAPQIDDGLRTSQFSATFRLSDA
jgi:hypothetical protein